MSKCILLSQTCLNLVYTLLFIAGWWVGLKQCHQGTYSLSLKQYTYCKPYIHALLSVWHITLERVYWRRPYTWLGTSTAKHKQKTVQMLHVKRFSSELVYCIRYYILLYNALERLYNTLEWHYNTVEYPFLNYTLNCTHICKLKTYSNQREVEGLYTSYIE